MSNARAAIFRAPLTPVADALPAGGLSAVGGRSPLLGRPGRQRLSRARRQAAAEGGRPAAAQSGRVPQVGYRWRCWQVWEEIDD